MEKLKLSSSQFRSDPWSTFGELRRKGPVIKIKIPIMGKMWAATTYETVTDVLKNDVDFVRDPANAGRKTVISWQWILPKVFNSLMHNMLGADHERHKRLRSIVDQAFNRRNIEGMTPRLETLANQQLDLMQEELQREQTADLIEYFARPFPLTVIRELLGLPEEDRANFRRWFAPFSDATTIFAVFKIKKGLQSATEYLKNQFDQVRRKPREGLMSELVQIEHEGDRLDEKELLAMVFLLLVAGHETTLHLISNSVYTLMQFPDTRKELVEDWSKGDTTIDEVLRYCTPLQLSKPRYIARDMDYHGQKLKRGEMITPLLAAANYDPSRFENPETFDIHRAKNYHMSFGSGPHVCLGMKLARAETIAALKALYERWPKLEPAFDLAHPNWNKRIGVRGFKSMPIRSSD